MTRHAFLFSALCLCATSAPAADLKFDRRIGKEPRYQTKTPRYGLLVFGREARDRVWLVQDGSSLYVDRNGNGDLTEPSKKVAAEKVPANRSEEGYSFDVGDLKVGGVTHKALHIRFLPLKLFADDPTVKRTDLKAALMRDPAARVAWLSVDVQMRGLKGTGVDGRVSFSAGPYDLQGALIFAPTPGEAPVVHVGGPLQVTFERERPSLRLNRATELYLVVGTPGVGSGTFSTMAYQDVVPESARPKIELSCLPSKTPGLPVKQSVTLANRC